MSSADRTHLIERVRLARAYAADRLPWFAPALYRCGIVLTDRVEVAAIDNHYNVYWNPEVVAAITEGRPRTEALAELAFLWIHEISHVLREHAKRGDAVSRAGGDYALRWNVACDLEINDAEWEGLQMPKAYPGHQPAERGFESGRLAEYYYPRLGGGSMDFPAIDEGSGVHGRPRPWETGGQQRLSDLEVTMIRREVARQTRQADTSRIPFGWRSWAREVLGSHINWQQRLRNRLSVAIRVGAGARTDYGYRRPHRRQHIYHPVVPPTLTGAMATRLAVVVDTSGSLEDDDLRRTFGEIATIMRQLEAPVTIIPCDTKAYDPVKLLTADAAFRVSHLPGGGGTDLRAGIRAAARLRPVPDAILVLTDGLTDYPDVLPAVPLVFGILTDREAYRLPPDPPVTPDRVVQIP